MPYKARLKKFNTNTILKGHKSYFIDILNFILQR